MTAAPIPIPIPFTSAEIKRLLCVPKMVIVDWRAVILAHVVAPGQHRVKIFDLTTGPTRGQLHVYGRVGVDPDDYSTGLVLYDLSNVKTTLIRLNGPHPGAHKNRLPPRRTLSVVPHAHYLTELYQRGHLANPKVQPTGYALPTTAYCDLDGAMAALARRANILASKPQLPFNLRSLP
jgi:hypothetical protein